jgi:type VI secretion system protein ImpA
MDFELLIRPLGGGAGSCGEEMIFSSEFDAIQEARRFEDPSLAQGEWITDVKEADWDKVIRLCDELLSTRTKDLRLVVWMTEALARKQGLAGLSDGYTLLTKLCESLWTDLHPLPEDGDMEARIGNLDWLVAQTINLIREVPLTQSARGAFSSADLESARSATLNIERNPDQAEELTQNARITLPLFDAARKETPGVYFVEQMKEAELAKSSVEQLKRVLDELMGSDSPVFGAVFDALETIHSTFRRYAGEAGSLEDRANQDEPAVAVAEPAGAATTPAVSGPIQSREQALRQLNEIATFFRRTEPHSPVAYLAEKAAKWGSMPLHEWLRSVVKDNSALLRVEELLGVEPPKSSSEE